ncbi:MAG: transglycosylase SLT domain-containing protein [Vulcanimicrobiota bacterium]
MNPAAQLLAEQQQTMQFMLLAMLSLLTGLMQGGQAGNQDASGTSSVSGTSSGGGASATQSAGGASSAGAPGDKVANARIVAEVARQKGVDPVTAVACMLVESGGSNAATGDNGTSFGLFQLHRGGELGNMSEAEARDPRRNAEVALSVFAANKGKYSDPGQLAAASQRPADREGYARKVDAMLPEARRLLGM